MKKLLIFGGTGDSRELIRALVGRQVSVTVSVATDYGADRFADMEGVEIVAGRMDEDAMVRFLEGGHHDAVVDATHPYAVAVTANIRAACERVGRPYHRLLRESGEVRDGVMCFSDLTTAMDYLKDRSGNILAATGSKDLAVYTQLPDFRARVFPRVLPLVSSIETCRGLGFAAGNIIAMQGPFSRELNLALMHQFGIRYLVTKDGGTVGGLTEKVDAAREAGVDVLLIARPDEGGLDMVALINELNRDLEVTP